MSLQVGNTYVFRLPSEKYFKAIVHSISAEPSTIKTQNIRKELSTLLKNKYLNQGEYKRILNKIPKIKIPEIKLEVTEKETSRYNAGSILNFYTFEEHMFVKNDSKIDQVVGYDEESSINNPGDSTSKIPEGIPEGIPPFSKGGGKKKKSPVKLKPAKRKPAKRKPAKRKPTGKKKVRKIHKGPRGGRYYISKGRKVYL